MGTPINRAPFNALIDDNGTGLTGSVWNKAAIQSVLLDPIDAAAAGAGTFPFSFGTALAATITAALYNDYYLGAATTWFLEPSMASTITGIKAEADGTVHVLINAAGYAITMPTKDARSLAANQLIGPGFGTYTLGVWKSVIAVYAQRYAAWVLMQP